MDRKKEVKKLWMKHRNITVVKPSKYETHGAIHANKNYWQTVFHKLDSLMEAPSPEQESRKLAEVLPSNVYRDVCHTLDLKLVKQPQDETIESSDNDKEQRRLYKEPLLSYRKTLYIDRQMDSDTDVELSPREEEEGEELNVYQEFLQRPEREQVTWATRYLLPEREDEKNLVRRADDLTDRIAQEFCDYMKQLGGDQKSQLLTPKAIKELFQVEFDTHVARSLKVVSKELPAINENVANATGHQEKSRYAVLEREVLKDIKAESKPSKLQAFGRCLSNKDKYIPPNNNTKDLWRSAKHVPKDLVTLKTVWEGITNLRSVKEYCRWMIEHPEYRRAPYLSSLGMFDPAVLEARLTFEAQHGGVGVVTPNFASPTGTLAPVDNIRRRLSQLADVA